MKKQLFIAAAALLALVGCTDDSFVGDQSLQEANENGAISFNLSTPAITRTEVTGKTAATALSNRFIVWGEKNETNGDAASDANKVFENYKVEWTDNSAYNTTSNTKNWEYVGIAPYAANVSPVISATTQTIKYWDYNASSYTFTAVSALDADITSGKVTITKNTSGSTVYDKGYEIAVKSGASLDNIFIADRNQPTKGTGTDRNAANAYGGNVKMTFRNFMSKIRFGIYENIPGYKVKITNVDYNSTSHSSGDGGTGKFGVDGKFLVAGNNTVFTVSYESSGTNQNKAKAAVKAETTPNSVTYLETAQSIAGSPILNTTPTEISITPTTPTWDKTDGAYTSILPFPSNNVSMKVQLDFTLTSEDTGETISVVDATAEIPAAYCKWLPNYAYTYILKLNDNTNGQIGGVTGLYPITFDAIEITDEYNGEAEYITTVSEPSITTFGAIYNGDDNKYTAYQTGTNEYTAQTSPNRLDIFATFIEGNEVKTPTVGGDGAQHVKVFKVTTRDALGFPITEASVAEAIANPRPGTKAVAVYTRSGEPGSYSYTEVTDVSTLAAGTTYYKADGSSRVPGTTGYEPTVAVAGTDYTVASEIQATNITSDGTTNFSSAPEAVTSVPAEDGTTKTINAVKLTGVKAGTYAIEYEASSAWTGDYKKVYKVIVVQ